MEHILSKQSQRFLTTLEHLYYNNYSSYENLANLSHVSIKTIQEDINKINDFIEPLSIQEYSQSEVHLKKQDNISCDFIYSCILSNSLEFSVLELVFFEQEDRLEDYADALFISLSTLKRIISKINARLKKKGIQISTNPIQLVGNEGVICLTMANFFKEKYLTDNYPFSKVQYKVFDQLVHYALSDYKEFLNYPDMDKLKLYSFIAIIRLQNGHSNDITAYRRTLNKEFDFPFLSNFIFKQTFKSVFHIELTKENIISFAYPFLNDNFAFNYQEMLKIANKNQKKREEFENLVFLLNDISESLMIPLEKEKKEKLLLDLFNVRLLMIGKTYLLYNAKRNFIINLAGDYPIIYQFVEEKIIANERFKNYSESEKEEIIYILLTHWQELFFAIQDKQPLFKAGLCMTSDIEHTQLLADMLNRKFYRRFDFQPIAFTSFKDAYKQFDNYDVIITNVSNLSNKKKPVVSIDLYPSFNDYAKIYTMYYNLNQ